VTIAYTGLLVYALFWALLSGIFLLVSPHEGGPRRAWFWGAGFVAASFAAAWSFWELLEGSV
jgi:hypothetical protein